MLHQGPEPLEKDDREVVRAGDVSDFMSFTTEKVTMR
jgi:hypothetical protein